MSSKIKVDTIENVAGSGNVSLGSGHNLVFDDNGKAIFGTGSDLSVWHNGSHSYVQDTGTGNLYLAGSNVIISNPTATETMAYFDDDGGASLWYDNAVKLATTTTGVDVTGSVTADGLTVDGISRFNNYIHFGGSISTPQTAAAIYRPADNQLSFSTANTERMRIDSSGRLLLNATVNNVAFSSARSQIRYSKTGEFGLHIRPYDNDTGGGQPVLFQNYAGGTIGSIGATASATSYNTSSDYRLKTDVTYDWDATSRLKQLKPARFAWIVDGDDAVPVDGFLAHEVQSIVPEAITGTHNEVDDEGNPVYQGIDQGKLVPLLVKTIQELEARIAVLEAK